MNNRIEKRKERRAQNQKVRKMKSLLKPTDGVQGSALLKGCPLRPAYRPSPWKWPPWGQVLTLRPWARGATVLVICSLVLRIVIDCHHQVWNRSFCQPAATISVVVVPAYWRTNWLCVLFPPVCQYERLLNCLTLSEFRSTNTKSNTSKFLKY
jgi:hypothetical protein